MRYLTLLVKADGGSTLHPLGEQLTADPAIERRAIHHVELLPDDTVLLFAEASGDRERYARVMEESPHVVDYLTAGDDRWMAVSQFEPTEPVRRALELRRESQLVIETPIRVTSDGSIKMTCLGTDETFEKLSEDVGEAESLRIELLEMGDYDPDDSSFRRMFTSRQEEVLETAVDLGYFDVPRQAELNDVAEVVGITPTTASEHLRKAEQRVFTEIVR
jgi:predicted DNA binding protein